MEQMEFFSERTLDILGKVRSVRTSDQMFTLAMKKAGLRYQDDPRAFGGKHGKR
jgi:hypothetical protein